MKRSYAVLLVLLPLTVFAQIKQIPGFEGRYSIAYWEPWAYQNNLNVFDSVARGPWNVILIGSNYVNTDGTLFDAPEYTPAFFNGAVARAHAQNVKILYTYITNPETHTWEAIGPANRLVHITSICNKLATYNFDGIDFDWEGGMGSVTRGHVAAFLPLLRDSLNARFGVGTKMVMIYAPAGDDGAMMGQQNHAMVDVLNIQAYDYTGYWNNYAGWNGPLFNSASGDGQSQDGYIRMYRQRGVPWNKIGVMSRVNGQSYMGVPRSSGGNGVTFAGQSLNPNDITNDNFENDDRYFYIHGRYNIATQAQYDAAAVQDYVSIDNAGIANDHFSSWDGVGAIARKIRYAKDSSAIAYTVWTVQGMFIGSWAPQVQVMKTAFAQGSTPTPTIVVSTSSMSFTSIAPNPSANQTYTVSGTDLATNISITKTGANPNDFEISTNSGTTWVSSITLVPSSGTVSNTTITVRFLRGTAGTSTATLNHASGTATPRNITLSGSASVPTINVSVTQLPQFNILLPNPSQPPYPSFVVTGIALSQGIQVTPPNADFQVSGNNGASWSTGFPLSSSGGTVWVRSVRSTTGYNSGNITLTSSPATQKTVFVEVTASNPAGCSVQDSLRIFNFGYNKCRIDSSGVAQREYLRGTIYGRDTLGLRKWGVDGNIAMIIKDNGDTLKYRLDFIR